MKPSTIRVYASYYRPYISPVIGQLSLSQITRRHILQIQAQAASKLCPATNNILLQVIKIILNEAVEDKLIPENPAKRIKAMQITQKASQSYHRALTREEQAQFMHAARDNFYYELLAFQLLTGMRLGEIGALCWNDIDWENRLIHVRRTITRTEEGAFFQFCPHPEADHGCFLLRCEACGRMVHLDCGHLEDLCRHLEAQHHFRIDPRQTILTGRCRSCVEKESVHELQ